MVPANSRLLLWPSSSLTRAAETSPAGMDDGFAPNLNRKCKPCLRPKADVKPPDRMAGSLRYRGRHSRLAQALEDPCCQVLVQVAAFEIPDNAIAKKRVDIEDATHRFGSLLLAAKLGRCNSDRDVAIEDAGRNHTAPFKRSSNLPCARW